jgi:acyl-CoA synthetase (AMP-forming)/AMP-acid ligase II
MRMPHMMDDFPLLLSTLYEHAVALFPEQEIVSVETDLSVRRTTYADTDVRIRKLAAALSENLGLGIGDVAGTFAWNNQRHHELYWATANTGRVAHTLNIRLFPEQPRWRPGDLRRPEPGTTGRKIRRQPRQG